MSVQTAKVEEVLRRHPWERDGEVKKVFYDLKVAGQDKPIDIGISPSKPTIEVGHELTFILTGEEDRGKLKAKEPRSNNSYGGGQRQAFKEDPDKAARIVRQHSQTASVALLEMAIGLGIIPKPESSEALLELVRKTANWLDKDVQAAVANAQLSLDDAQRRSEDGF